MEWLKGFKEKKNDLTICHQQETYFKFKDIHKLKEKW